MQIGGIKMEIEQGYYINLFPINIIGNEFEIMKIDRTIVKDLKELNQELEKKGVKIVLYPDGDLIYGYGENSALLEKYNFQLETVTVESSPRLTGKMILDGVISVAEEINYFRLFIERKGRTILFNPDLFDLTSDTNVKVHRVYDIRIIYLIEPVYLRLFFGLVINCRYLLRDSNDQPLNFVQIISRFGSRILREVRQLQKDLIPSGLNPETSRQRLVDEIIPFVKTISKITLACRLDAIISSDPVRIILGDDEDISLW